MARLLICHDCNSKEPLPDPPRGVDPMNIHPGQDPLFDELVSRHRFPNGEDHLGQLVTIEQKHWDDPYMRPRIMEEIDKGLSAKGFGTEFYEFRDTLSEDAVKCFIKHGRPERCIDWMDDSKRLGRPTKEGRRFARQNPKFPQPFLCHYCPVASLVESKIHERKS